jgi:predicted ferric reductase
MVEKKNYEEEKLDLQTALVAGAALVIGFLLTLLVLPDWLPALSLSLQGTEVKMFWYLSRATAILAYIFLWFSMMLGLLLSNRLAGEILGGRVTNEFHSYFSLLGLFFTVVHALLLMGDAYLAPSLLQVLVPFGLTSYRPFWVGMGQIGFYMWLMIILSFYLKKQLGYGGWRFVHYSSFVLFVLAFAHAIFSGSDSSSMGMFTLHWVSAASTLFLVVFRVIAAVFKRLGSAENVKKAV